MRHSCPVSIPQKLVAEIPVNFQRRHDGVAILKAVYGLSHAGQQIQLFQANPCSIRIHDLGQFPRHEESTPQEVGAAEIAAVLQKSSVLRRGEPAHQRSKTPAESSANLWKDLAPSERTHNAWDLLETWVPAQKLVAPKARKSYLQAGLRRDFAYEIRVHAVYRRKVHGSQDSLDIFKEILLANPLRLM